MRPTRGTGAAIFGFGMVVALVVGGLAWASVASLRLERERVLGRVREAQRVPLHLAMWRLDSLVKSILVREESRPYYHYSAYYYPGRVWWTASGQAMSSGSVVEASPLLRANQEDWLLLHFQVTENGIWGSPQIEPLQASPAQADDEHARLTRRRERLLADLAAEYAPDALLKEVVAARRTAARSALPHYFCPDCGAVLTAGHQHGQWRRTSLPQRRLRRVAGGGDYGLRKTHLSRKKHAATELCDPAAVVQSNVGNLVAYESPSSVPDASGNVSVASSPMVAVWLELASQPGPLLSFVRTVDIGDGRVLQGFVVDWPRLVEVLTDSVADLFPDCRLERVVHNETTDPDTMMTTLPARLAVAGTPPPPPQWTTTHTTLAWAWGAALTVLAAVGLGVRNLVSLTERRRQFAYAVTHELRTPLTTLRLYTDMLAGGFVAQERREEYLQTVNRESQRLSELVNGILEYSRLENQSVRLDLAQVTVGELLAAIHDSMEQRCQSAHKELVVEPDGASDLRLTTDPQLVRQIVSTLVENSCKHSNPATDRRVIIGTRIMDHDRIGFQVEDRGPGISRRDRRRIFRPFRRGRQSAREGSGGLGLGLALARGWAGLLGGDLVLVRDGRQPPGGACFRLTIPMSNPESVGGNGDGDYFGADRRRGASSDQ